MTAATVEVRLGDDEPCDEVGPTGGKDDRDRPAQAVADELDPAEPLRVEHDRDGRGMVVEGVTEVGPGQEGGRGGRICPIGPSSACCPS